MENVHRKQEDFPGSRPGDIHLLLPQHLHLLLGLLLKGGVKWTAPTHLLTQKSEESNVDKVIGYLINTETQSHKSCSKSSGSQKLLSKTGKCPIKFVRPFEWGDLPENPCESATAPIHLAQVVRCSSITGLHNLGIVSLSHTSAPVSTGHLPFSAFQLRLHRPSL